ncbi:chromate efflux transporter [Aestuariibius sp. 2305UL40-4]|uniref:chromate efflux transporter n=1 Tax=Aestuariibius violaceus TaxID=3234132 RepID=UPI00345E9B64
MEAPTLLDITRVGLRIGVLSFGGPTAQIALMHKELVEDRPWLTEEQYLRALSFCMLLPGPEAMQLATYAGWRLRGIPGGLIAGSLFVIPGAVVIMALALLYARFGEVPLIEAMFLGIKAAVVVIVAQALVKIARRALTGTAQRLMAVLGFIALFFFDVPFPAVILIAGIVGAFLARGQTHEPTGAGVSPARTLRVFLVGGVIWALPLVLALSLNADLLVAAWTFFSKLAVVTFGGAYAVLAYMTQEVVQDLGWLTTEQMIAALGLAETTPGPLILVTQFVAALTGVSQGGTGLAFAMAGITLWATFVPCFIWIFAGAPYIDWLAGRPKLTGALTMITAAVVGVIANLSLWFALHVLFASNAVEEAGPLRVLVPDLSSFSPTALALTALAALLLMRFGWSIPLALAVLAAAGGVAGAL